MSELVQHLNEIHRAGAEGGAELMAAVDAATDALIGHRLFTIMVLRHDTLEVERLYSNMPQAYPAGGRKRKRDTWWGQHVLLAGEPFLGAGPLDLEKAFGDHELIKSLGLDCVLNMPVVFSGRTYGTMNLLRAGKHYDQSHIPVARALAMPLLAVMACGGKQP